MRILSSMAIGFCGSFFGNLFYGGFGAICGILIGLCIIALDIIEDILWLEWRAKE